MTEESKKTVALEKEKTRSLYKSGLKAVIGLALVIIILGAAALLYLGSSAGLSLVLKKTEAALAAKGISLRYESVEGPLPMELSFTGLSLSDKEGVFLTADEASLKLSPLKLLQRLLRVDLVRLEGLDFKRPPILPPGQAEKKDGPFSLPVSVTANLLISNSKILSAKGGGTAASLLLLEGSVSYLRDVGPLWNLKGSWAPPGGEGVSLETDLQNGSLRLDLAAALDRDGPLSFLMTDLEIPWKEAKLAVRASGSPEIFTGNLNLTDSGFQGPSFPDDSGASGIKGDFVLSAEKNADFQSLLRNPELLRNLRLRLRSSPDFPLPKGLEDATGEDLLADLDLKRAGGSALAGEIRLSAAKGEIALSPIKLDFGDGRAAVSLEGSFAVDPSILGAPAAADGAESGSAPKEAGSGRKGSPDKKEAEEGAEPRVPRGASYNNVTGKIPPDPFRSPPARTNSPAPAGAGYEKGGPSSGKPLVKPASLDPAGEDSPPTAAENAPEPAPESAPSASADNAAPPAPQSPPPFGRLKGDVKLDAEFGSGGIRVENLLLTDEGLRLELSGNYAGLNGRSAAELALTLSKGEDYSRLVPGFPAGFGSDADLKLTARYDGEKKEVEELKLDLLAGRIEGFYPPLQGRARLTLDSSGSLEKRLPVTLFLESPEITRTTGTESFRFERPRLAVQGEFHSLISSPSFYGKIDLEAFRPDDSKLLSLTADPRMNFAHGFEIGAGKLAFSGLGALVRGSDLKVSLSDGKDPELRGSLFLDVESYRELEKLLGTKITGAPLSLALNFSKEGDPPGVSGTLENEALALGPVAISQTSLDFNLRDPFHAPNLDMDLATGKGEASLFKWSRGRAKVSGFGPGGPAQVSVSFEEGAKRELLKLEGEYDPKAGMAVLKSFAFAPPETLDRVALNKPVKISFGERSLNAPADGAGSGSVSLDDLSLSFGKASLKLTGAVFPPDLSLEVRDLPYRAFSGLSGAALPEGKLSLDLKYKKGGNAEIKLESDPTIEREDGPPFAFKIALAGRLENSRRLVGEAEIKIPGPASGNPARIKYQIPFLPRGEFAAPDLSGPVKLDLGWSGDVRALWAFLNLNDRSLYGNAEIRASLEGSLDSPKPSAEIYLAGAGYDDEILSLFLSDINLSAVADNRGEKIIARAAATDGAGGTVALEGTLTLSGTPSLQARGQIKSLSPLHRDDLDATVSALVSIDGPITDLTIKTQAIVEALEANLSASIGGPSVATLEIDEGYLPQSSGPALDVTVEIPRGAYVRGRGLDSEWKGNLRITGPAGAPVINGNLSPIRGFFTLMGKEFTFSGGGITFRNQSRLNPGLDIELHRNVSDLTAIVRVTGLLDAPRLKFESNPPYPQDEVLAQVLFGKPAAELSRFETIQLANSLRELAGVGSGMPNPLTTMRDALGLSVLRIGEASANSDRHLEGNDFRKNLGLGDDDETSSESDTAPTLEAGKYLTDNIYVGVDQNLVDNSTGVRVEIELSPSVNLVSRSSATSSRVGVGWKHDY
ncbi:MAG: translocation/assembly module TamB domain-containing protein [Deltaproteobacteria bacterium]|jgi:translocation and assembly module TamB|nr:translocation/assembly module TamB domain-containing protein [Deltaproteobacteria bacterium]